MLKGSTSRGIALNRAVYRMSHNVDFATYSRTGVFWRGGLLHSVSGVSYWTLRTGIVGHLRPYVNNGRFLEAARYKALIDFHGSSFSPNTCSINVRQSGIGSACEPPRAD